MSASALQYELRIRDLVHGFVYLTSLEVRVINHPLFQRLRQVRQNDVAYTVYPSLNTSRFEHSLGCASVAGRMAINIVRSRQWGAYERELKLDQADFEQLCRLYALLHDVGHLPLSHLFEIALEDWAGTKSIASIVSLAQDWFGGQGFSKMHEACGYAVTKRILEDLNTQSPADKQLTRLNDKILKLMGNKKLDHADVLRPIKLLVDSEIDADRIDSTARDGLLAGREYGTYDIDRICTAVFLRKHESSWGLAYSHKALGSIESLLLDRYRTHTWIHFHHRVVAMKAAVMELISGLLKKGIINKESFSLERSGEMALRDDVWLWSLLRTHSPPSEEITKGIHDFVFYRDKTAAVLVWKNRTVWKECYEALLKKADRSELDEEEFDRRYEDFLGKEFGSRAVVFLFRFSPVGKKERLPLTGEDGSGESGDVLSSSKLVRSLVSIWSEEPQFYVVIFGKQQGEPKELEKRWVKATAEWIVSVRPRITSVHS